MKSIIQINSYTRQIEKFYKNLSWINSEEFDIELVKKCCDGIISHHGGKYSESGLIWRYVKDIPFLKPNFDFYDKVLFSNNLSLNSQVDRDVYFSNEYTSTDNDISQYNNYNYIDESKTCVELLYFIRFNAFYNYQYCIDQFMKSAIIQCKNGKIINVYPNISHIPSNLHDTKAIRNCLYNHTEYNDNYKWIKYQDYYKANIQRLNHFNKSLYKS